MAPLEATQGDGGVGQAIATRCALDSLFAEWCLLKHLLHHRLNRATGSALERILHIQNSHGQIMALASR